MQTSVSLADLLVPAAITTDLKSPTKDEALAELCGLLAHAGLVKDAAAALKSVQAREAMGSTGCGSGVAVPHARVGALERTAVAVGLSKAGIDYGAPDGEKVRFLFLLLGPTNAPEAYLKVLSQIARLVKDPDFRDALIACESSDAVVALVRQHS